MGNLEASKVPLKSKKGKETEPPERSLLRLFSCPLPACPTMSSCSHWEEKEGQRQTEEEPPSFGLCSAGVVEPITSGSLCF